MLIMFQKVCKEKNYKLSQQPQISPKLKAQLFTFLLYISFTHSSNSYWASTMCHVWAGQWKQE